MFNKLIFNRAVLTMLLTLISIVGPSQATAEDQSLIQDSRTALKALYEGSPGAKALGDKSKGVLVFPEVIKAGLVVGGQTGDGVLFMDYQRLA